MLKSYAAFLLSVSLLSASSVFAQDDNPTGDDIAAPGVPGTPKFDDNPTGNDPRAPGVPKFDDNPVRRPLNNTNTTDSSSSSNVIEFPSYIYLTSLFYLFV